jgi:hypothetical protein
MRPSTLALRITAGYPLPTAAAVAWVWYHTKPQYHGMDRIGVGLITFPGCGAVYFLPYGEKIPNSIGILIGVIVNSSALYLLIKLFFYLGTKFPPEPSTNTVENGKGTDYI